MFDKINKEVHYYTHWNSSKTCRQSKCRGKSHSLAGINLFKGNHRNIKTDSEICSEITLKAPEQSHWRQSGTSIVNFEYFHTLYSVPAVDFD